LKIAMYNLTTTCRFGGVETFVWEVSRELARRGEEVHILGGKGNRTQNIARVRLFLFPFWSRDRIPNFGSRFRKLFERLSMGLFALRTLERERYAILHIHKPFDLPLGAWIKKRTGARLVLGSHGTDFFGGDRLFAPAVDAAVSCSRFNGSLLARRYGFTPEVIYNGIDPRRFHPFAEPDAALRKRYGFSAEDFVIIFVGRLIGLKGVKILLKAVSSIRRKDRLKVLVAGDGQERNALEGLSRKLGMEKNMVFAGFVPHEEVPRYFSISRLAVFPSLADEAFGISLCEAMACGLPVIGTRVGGIPELIEDEETGFLVKPGDEGALADKIEKLIESPDAGREMGWRAAQRVRELFTWEKVADRLMQVYGRVLTEGKG
jgi:D-inositol-3-phosphate glycosyltransferase